MKVFFYDPGTGIYQGEGFEADDRELPEGVTLLAPPRYGRGNVPVFSTEKGCWSIRKILDLRTRRTEGEE